MSGEVALEPQISSPDNETAFLTGNVLLDDRFLRLNVSSPVSISMILVQKYQYVKPIGSFSITTRDLCHMILVYW